jgi:hypothetical protein
VDEVLMSFPKKKPLPQELVGSFIDMRVTVHLKLIEMDKLKDQVQHGECIGTYTVLTSSINMAFWCQAFFKRAIDKILILLGMRTWKRMYSIFSS